MFHLHGDIIEDVGLPAASPDFGEYEYAAMLGALQGHGFVVIRERRPEDMTLTPMPGKIVAQVNTLLEADVPAGNISVVRAPTGSLIAATVSFLLPDPSIHYVLIGTCHPDTVKACKSSGSQFHGNVLTIRDLADLEYSGSCEDLSRDSNGEGPGRHEEIVLQIGTGHDMLFKPLEEWALPTGQRSGE